MERLLLIGLDPPESSEIIRRTGLPAVAYPVLPRIKVERGSLLVERTGAAGRFVPVDRVIYHGIFEDDFDTLMALALWGGPCLPSAQGMMDCRQRIPCLARALRVTRFGALPRSWAARGVTLDAGDRPAVAKWGNWHCGEDKEQFTGPRTFEEPTLVEDFVDGQAVRIMLIGDQAWQVRLTGEGWKKSIHPDDAGFMPIDPELLDDTRRLQAHFGLAVIGNDYMIGADGARHLLEVNHIPNVTRFEEVRGAYLEFASRWAVSGS